MKKKGLLLFLVLVLSLFLWTTSLGQPAAVVLYAKPTATGTGDCSSWANACALRDALGSAVTEDEIWVAAGIHTPTNILDETVSFDLYDVAIYGGFEGTETLREQRDWETNVTVLSGDLEGNDLTDPNGVITDTANIVPVNSLTVVDSSWADFTAVLDGFTITGGDAFGGGGGLYNDGGSPTLANLVFSGNQAGSGGGMYNTDSAIFGAAPTLTNVTFTANSANFSGGGILNDRADISLTDVTFAGNIAIDGGGMSNEYSDPMLTNVDFAGNMATQNGGGLHNTNECTPVLTNVTFSNNEAGNGGGGIYNYNLSNPRLTEAIFHGNTADYGAGMYNRFISNVVLKNATFSQNIAAEDGGGIYNDDNSSPTLVNVIFAENVATLGNGGGYFSGDYSVPDFVNVAIIGNTAVEAGGMHLDSGNIDLTNVIFSGNSSQGSAGGLYLNGVNSATLTNVTFSQNSAEGNGGGLQNLNSSPTLINVIMWGNTAVGDGAQMDNFGTSAPDISYSLIEDGCPVGATCPVFPAPGVILTDDPLFQDPLGPDNTAGTLDDDLSLQFSSPAVEVGDNAALPADIYDLDNDSNFGEQIPYDIAGNPRISGLGVVDLGAYELGCFGTHMYLGSLSLTDGQLYRWDFHGTIPSPTNTISATLASYATSGLAPFATAKEEFKAALACAETPAQTETALTHLLDTSWELATGGMLTGNEFVVQASDIVYENPLDPLAEEIDQLQQAVNWYSAGTSLYLELLDRIRDRYDGPADDADTRSAAS